MTEKEALLTQLAEYNAALERLQRDAQGREVVTPNTLAHQVFHLERKILQLQTELSVLDLRVRRPENRESGVNTRESLWAYLNPWHPQFHMWSYVAILALLMLVASIAPILWGT